MHGHYNKNYWFFLRLQPIQEIGAKLTRSGPLSTLRGLSCALSGAIWSSILANTKSAEKAARQAVKRRAHNVAATSKMRSAIREVVTSIDGGNKTQAAESYKGAVPVIDSMVSKGMIHKNKAARHKSRLAARIRSMS